MPELSLYMTSWCSFCARVIAAIDALDLEVELRDIDAQASFRDELQAATGRATVPCLRMVSDAGEVSWQHESRDIIAALQGFAGR